MAGDNDDKDKEPKPKPSTEAGAGDASSKGSGKVPPSPEEQGKVKGKSEHTAVFIDCDNYSRVVEASSRKMPLVVQRSVPQATKTPDSTR